MRALILSVLVIYSTSAFAESTSHFHWSIITSMFSQTARCQELLISDPPQQRISALEALHDFQKQAKLPDPKADQEDLTGRSWGFSGLVDQIGEKSAAHMAQVIASIEVDLHSPDSTTLVMSHLVQGEDVYKWFEKIDREAQRLDKIMKMPVNKKLLLNHYTKGVLALQGAMLTGIAASHDLALILTLGLGSVVNYFFNIRHWLAANQGQKLGSSFTADSHFATHGALIQVAEDLQSAGVHVVSTGQKLISHHHSNQTVFTSLAEDIRTGNLSDEDFKRICEFSLAETGTEFTCRYIQLARGKNGFDHSVHTHLVKFPRESIMRRLTTDQFFYFHNGEPRLLTYLRVHRKFNTEGGKKKTRREFKPRWLPAGATP